MVKQYNLEGGETWLIVNVHILTLLSVDDTASEGTRCKSVCIGTNIQQFMIFKDWLQEEVQNPKLDTKWLLLSVTKLWQGYVFTPVCHSVHTGGQCMLGYTHLPWADTSPQHTPSPGQTPSPPSITPPCLPPMLLQWTVHILLECILVFLYFF